MLSAQCDELRRLASTLDTRYRYADDIATALCEAADTIWDLRNRCSDLVGKRDAWQENDARLRELARDLYDAIDSVFWDGEAETRERFESRMAELGIEVDG